jgi:hypothetical protein
VPARVSRDLSRNRGSRPRSRRDYDGVAPASTRGSTSGGLYRSRQECIRSLCGRIVEAFIDLRVAFYASLFSVASGARNTASSFSIDQTVRHIEAAREAGCILSPRALRCRRMRAIRGPWADLRAVEARRAIRRRDERPLFARRIFHRRVGLSAAPNISDRRRRTNSRAPGPVLSKSVARRRPCSERSAAHCP